MRTLALRLLAVLGLVAGCGGGNAGPPIDDICRQGCTTGATLACPGPLGTVEACTANCVFNYRSSPAGCRSNWVDYVSCAAQRPVADWACYDNGQPDLAANVCEPEGFAATQCLYGLM